jgi:UDP-N-acetylmuramyl pentapeptide phosphotransferase/UDP-N-acetylglucosamine-1-phosphate transferase
VGVLGPAYYFIFLILGGLGAWIISRWGQYVGLLDRPNERSSHNTPVPKGGGLGILAAFLCASLSTAIPVTFWLPIALVALLSLFADKLDISPVFRLLFQFAASAVFAAGFMQFNADHGTGIVLAIGLAVFIVGTANYYNFMDGINGIASITGIIAFGLLAAYGALNGADDSLTALSFAVMLGCLGFLPFNFPRARVFMGDAGSILLGFFFAATVAAMARDVSEFACLVSFLFPFYADELTTTVVRIRDSENLLKPHRRHVYQLLANEKGIAHWKISLFYGVLQLLVGLSAYCAKPYGPIGVICVLSVFFLGFALFGSRVRRSAAAVVKP